MRQTRKQDERQKKDYAEQATESGDPQITGKPKGTNADAKPGKRLGKNPKDDVTDAPESGRADANPS